MVKSKVGNYASDKRRCTGEHTETSGVVYVATIS